MTEKTRSSDGDPERAVLERRATTARWDLGRKLDALDERRRDLTALPSRVARSPWTFAVALGVLAFVGFALAAYLRRRAER